MYFLVMVKLFGVCSVSERQVQGQGSGEGGKRSTDKYTKVKQLSKLTLVKESGAVPYNSYILIQFPGKSEHFIPDNE